MALARKWDGLEPGQAPPDARSTALQAEPASETGRGDEDEFSEYVAQIGQNSSLDLAVWDGLSGNEASQPGLGARRSRSRSPGELSGPFAYHTQEAARASAAAQRALQQATQHSGG